MRPSVDLELDREKLKETVGQPPPLPRGLRQRMLSDALPARTHPMPTPGSARGVERMLRLHLLLVLPALVGVLLRFAASVPARILWPLVAALVGLVLASRALTPRLEARRFERMREESRRRYLARRTQNVPDQALSPARRLDDPERGLSRSDAR